MSKPIYRYKLLSQELYEDFGEPITYVHSDRAERLEALLLRYRTEVPLGHQPHMIAAEVDEVLGRE